MENHTSSGLDITRFRSLSEQQKKKFRWVTPVLPLAGAKSRRWWREIQTVADLLPKGSRVLDAFAGTFCVSRILKDVRPDLKVTVNDFEWQYMTRLDAIYQTTSLWKTLHDTIQYDEAKQTKFLKFTTEQERVFKNCLDQAVDKTTVSSWGNGYGSMRNKVPKTPPDLQLAKTWTQGLEFINIRMRPKCSETKDLIRDHDFIIMDPPYTNTNCRKHYSDATKEAREWCFEAIHSDKMYMLWDLESSDLLKESVDSGALLVSQKVMGYTGKDTGKESLVVNYPPASSRWVVHKD